MEIIINAFELILTFDKDLYEIIFLSLKVSTIALFFSIILGLPISAFVATNNFVGKKIIKVFFNSLMALPPVFVGLILYVVFSNNNNLEIIYYYIEITNNLYNIQSNNNIICEDDYDIGF